jgi:hypothetical protein
MPFLIPMGIAAATASGGLAGAGAAALGSLTGGAAVTSAAGLTSLATAGLSTAGSLISGLGILGQGNYAKSAADANAQMLDTQAAQTRAAGKSQANQQAIFRSRQIGGARADYGASGVETSGGSPLAVLNENIRQSQLESFYTRVTANQQASNIEQEADIMRQRGKQAKDASFINAGTGLLTGFGNSLLSRI